jgi:general secretion pathway protein N
MNRWGMLAVVSATYLATLIALAPATLLDAGLRGASKGRLRLVEASGTLWTGSGQIEIRDAAGRTGVARAIAWRVMPESLLRGHLVCEVELEHSGRRFPVTLSPSRIDLANADISLPAAVLGLGVPSLAALGLTGEVLIHVSGLAIARDAVDGNATLRWRAAASVLTPVSPLGDYEIRMDGEGTTLHAYLRTIEGPLQLDGKGSWTRGDNPAFAATAYIPPLYQQQLAPLLRLIAIEREEGRFDLRLD